MTMTMTYHAQVEREARIDYIIDVLGDFGQPIAKRNNPANNTITILTNLGVIIIKSNTTQKLVTMFLASIAQATAIYRDCYGGDTCPHSLMVQVKRNQKFLAGQP